MTPATLALSAGMFMYGWTADMKTHWILPNIRAAIFMGAAMACAIAVNTYLFRGHKTTIGSLAPLFCLLG
jgi:hypothetical protein